ncbi:MAG: hypothetical protein JNK82_09960, partial [Myxococcaceae bacterium]|nr:hypothetical protein [Myxococcaceae bacterium]
MPSSSTFGGVLATLPFETTTTFKGATSSNGTGALETTNHNYDYGSVGQTPRGFPQLKVLDERASVLSTGQQSSTNYFYDTATNRLKGVIRRGYTQAFDEGTGTFSTVERFIGTFYFTSRVCSGGSADPLGRTLEVHGPCLVSSLSSTDCDVGSEAPITQYEYFGSGSGADSYRLNKVHRLISGSSPSS